MRQKSLWMDGLPLLATVILAPLFLFPSIRLLWPLAFIPLAWAVRGISRKQLLPRTVFDLSILVLLIQVFATCLIVPDLAFSLPKITGVIFGVLTLYALQPILRSERLLKAGILIYLIGGFLFSVLSPLGMIRYNVKHLDKIFRLSNILPKIEFNIPGAETGFHPNAVGGTLTLFVPLFLAMTLPLLQKRSRSGRLSGNKFFSVFTAAGLLFSCLSLLITQSRGSWTGVMLSSLLILFSFFKFPRWTKGLVVFAVFALIVLTVLGTGSIPKSFQEARDKTVTRMELWKISVKTVEANPLWGIGMNRIRTSPGVGYRTAHAHNHYLHTASEIGIPGLIAYLALLLGAGFLAREIWSRAETGWVRLAALGLAGGLLAQALFGMFDSIPLGAKVGIFFWLSLGLITSLHRFALTEEK